jgi:hypothetical protein
MGLFVEDFAKGCSLTSNRLTDQSVAFSVLGDAH